MGSVSLWEESAQLSLQRGHSLSVHFYRATQSVSALLSVERWLSVCLSVCLFVRPSVRPSHAGIVSKRLKLSENFFNHLVAPSF